MRFIGQPLEIKVRGEQTGGAYAVTEAVSEPGFGPAAHIHDREHETVYVVDGELRFEIDGETLNAPAGTLVHIPRGVLHTFTNVAASPTRAVTTYTPAGFEQIFEALGEPIREETEWSGEIRPDPAALRARAAEFGLRVPNR